MEPQVNNIITREIQVRAITDELAQKRQAEFVISSEAVDNYGTVFKMDGWNLNRFNNNPVVLYGHRSWDGNPDFVIGTGEVFREGDKLIGRVTFEPEEDNALAEKVFRKVKRGTIRMASIGADPQEGSFGKKDDGEDPSVFYFRSQDLLEFSLVPIGSNPDALKRNAQVIESFKSEVPNYIEGGLVEGVSFSEVKARHENNIQTIKAAVDKVVASQTRNIEVTDAQDVSSSEVENNTESKKLLSIREAQLIINKSKNVQ